MSWTDAAAFYAFGKPVLWTDLVGNVCALGTVWLAIRRTIWTWPVQLLGSALLFVASVSAHITGNALKQALFGVLAVYGWVRWTRGMRGGAELPIRSARVRERVALVSVMIAGTVAVALLFVLLNSRGWKISWAPWPDAYIFVGSAVATWAQGRALVDFWIIWVAVDLVGVPLAFNSGLVVSGLVYGVFFVMVLIGFRGWLRQSRELRAVTA
ncbi:nicotinamide mononucleotide transporter family protein [Microbispora bryophytorum]|uniref:Membrane protein n=1 Tax=Microbispora bryophytorum TaxID=1460882 RepID=A0A8H9GZ20_9ACTN|nr:nicotinamide mononucleotide transporter family protein [Microbispora bryophytorum]MBD3134855.1 nicotinamide mononucleotide transporter [Microbispora bryophytorum]TQS08888.1 nicotinamide mononucleotide transporter [Microbispora bryophytorum]GGO11931.1 membrane protein [Microbispora bryophytorum]